MQHPQTQPGRATTINACNELHSKSFTHFVPWYTRAAPLQPSVCCSSRKLDVRCSHTFVNRATSCKSFSIDPLQPKIICTQKFVIHSRVAQSALVPPAKADCTKMHEQWPKQITYQSEGVVDEQIAPTNHMSLKMSVLNSLTGSRITQTGVVDGPNGHIPHKPTRETKTKAVQPTATPNIKMQKTTHKGSCLDNEHNEMPDKTKHISNMDMRKSASIQSCTPKRDGIKLSRSPSDLSQLRNARY